jgi:hypothetical protein
VYEEWDREQRVLMHYEAAANTVSGCYEYLKRLLLIPEEAAANTLRGC